MLVLSRKEGENILIGDDIILTVVEVRNGNKVRLGIKAPENVVILRQEVYDRQQKENTTRPDQELPSS